VQGQEFFDCIEPPPEGFKYDVSFQGWVTSHQTREEATTSCLNTDGLKCDFALYNDFFGYLKPEDPEYERRKREHHRSLMESRLALCPESINGVFPYRFFEAMAAGRVPILVGRDFVFPMRERIPWDSFCVVCSRESAMNVGLLAKEILRRTTDDDLLIMGAAAQYY